MEPLPSLDEPARGHGHGDRPVGRPFASRSPVLATGGIAATSQPLASQVAVGVLRAGGSAVDAAIAANAALGLMEPTGSGLGGDLFALVWDPAGRRLCGLNASGPAPRGMTLAALKERLGGRARIPLYGALCVSVPGAVDGWRLLHERFGRRPWADVLAPAIGYARDGFPVSPVIAHEWQVNADRFEQHRSEIAAFGNLRATFLPEGRAPRQGEVFRNPDLAATLTTLAEEGPRAFYEGRIADVVDVFMRRIDGPLRRADLAGFEAVWVDPVSVTYRGVTVYELPPNGQGLAALQMLNILEGFDLAAMGHNSADYLHVHAEAKKLAFEDRARFYADPDFADIPLDGLLSKDYAARRRARIRMDRAQRQIEPDDPRLHLGDTVYLTVADRDGMMVSLIQSNYLGMGSGLVPDGLGFVLQNRGALFHLDEAHPNAYAPGKRPFHTIIPAFAMNEGEPLLSFGVMGGAMQPQGHAQILCNLLDFGMDVQEAGDAARYRHTGSSQPTGGTMTDGGTLRLETGVDPAVVEALRERGHAVQVARDGYGGYQAILRDPVTGVYRGATEMRKDGMVAGY
ncbi:gamma-glutamyltransferase [Rhodothermaceae bacterium RA]|nr:gamma-glutamyltransferase [Rhodothermaceae bacterium RA]